MVLTLFNKFNDLKKNNKNRPVGANEFNFPGFFSILFLRCVLESVIPNNVHLDLTFPRGHLPAQM